MSALAHLHLHWLDLPYFLLIFAPLAATRRRRWPWLASGCGQLAVSAAAGVEGWWLLCGCAALLGVVLVALWPRIRRRPGRPSSGA